MIYNEFQDLQLSALGLGTMRLPVINGRDADINVEEAQQIIDYALAHGVNYIDTAWGYHDGNSELVVGQALKKHPRDSFYVATKFPGYDLSNMPRVREIFPRQLEKLQMDYVDFYLFHNVCELNIDEYQREEKYGIYDYLTQMKREGRIRHLGFSAHGSIDVIRRFLDRYGEGMEFCQLQVNWLDWDFQDARSKVELIQSHGIPVWVMEPLRGGKLASLEPRFMERLSQLRPGETAAGWAFRFLQSIGATVVLTGSSSLEQIQQSIATYETHEPLNDDEMQALFGIAREMVTPGSLPCTACRYCTSHCPQELDIPALLALYNEEKFTQGGFIAPMALMSYDADHRPDACLGCGSCAAVCPQQIDIPTALADFAQMMQKSGWF